MRTFMVALCVMVLAFPVQAERIYKWRDEKGVLHFSKVPPKKRGESIAAVDINQVNAIDLSTQKASIDNNGEPKGKNDLQIQREISNLPVRTATEKCLSNSIGSGGCDFMAPGDRLSIGSSSQPIGTVGGQAAGSAWKHCIPNSIGPGGCDSIGPGGGRSIGPGGGLSIGPGGGQSIGPGGGQSIGPGGGQSIGPGGGKSLLRDRSRGLNTDTMRPY